MTSRRFTPIFLLFLVGAVARAEDPPAWEEVSNEDGITVWSRDIPDSDVVAFKGAGIIEASIAKVMMILSDTSRKKEWVANLVETRNVREISRTERIEYNHTSAPWPCDDRDFVFNAKMSVDREKKTITIALRSVKDESVPEKEDVVRGDLLDSRYLLEVVAPNRTRLTVEIQADPKGSIPKWVANMVQKGWPRKTIMGIRNQAAKADVGELVEVATLFDDVASVTTSTR